MRDEYSDMTVSELRSEALLLDIDTKGMKKKDLLAALRGREVTHVRFNCTTVVQLPGWGRYRMSRGCEAQGELATAMHTAYPDLVDILE